MEEFETKETALVKQKVNKAIREVEEVSITNIPTLENAKIILSNITNAKKILKNVKEEMTKPINEGLKRIRAFFAPVEDRLDEAEMRLKEKMLVYNEKVKIEVAQKKEQIAERVESGEVGFDKGSKQMEKVDNKIKAIPTRKIREIEIIDETKIPKKYWELNMVILRKDALAGVEIDGVKVVEKEIIVSH